MDGKKRWNSKQLNPLARCSSWAVLDLSSFFAGKKMWWRKPESSHAEHGLSTNHPLPSATRNNAFQSSFTLARKHYLLECSSSIQLYDIPQLKPISTLEIMARYNDYQSLLICRLADFRLLQVFKIKPKTQKMSLCVLRNFTPALEIIHTVSRIHKSLFLVIFKWTLPTAFHANPFPSLFITAG